MHPAIAREVPSDLALALANSSTVDEAVRAYQNIMLPRSTEMAKVLERAAEDLLSGEVPDFGDEAQR